MIHPWMEGPEELEEGAEIHTAEDALCKSC